MKAFTKIMLGFVAILLCGITACQVHYYKARRTPVVSGKVVDIETGEPIKGADVDCSVFGNSNDPLTLASPRNLGIVESCVKTNGNGEFTFPSQRPMPIGVSWWSYYIWGPDTQTGIMVFVHSKDYLTVKSNSEGFNWTDDPCVANEFPDKAALAVVQRKGDVKHGFEYTIKIKRAVTEEEWKRKCRETLEFTRSSIEPDETWRFEDLVGYLERFPDGEKAGEYLIKLCDIVIPLGRDFLDNPIYYKASNEQIRIWVYRKNKVLELNEKNPAAIKKEKYPTEYKNWSMEIQWVKEQTAKLEKCITR